MDGNKYDTKDNKSDFGVNVGYLSLSKALCCRVFILLGCAIFTYVFVVLNLSEANFVSNSDSLPPSYQDLKASFKERNQLLRRVCRKYSNPIRAESGAGATIKIEMERYFYIRKPKFTMCMIPKVASTSLSIFITELAKNTSQDNLIRQQEEIREHLRDSYKAIVVRHPFERILSAYLYFFTKEIDREMSDQIKEIYGKNTDDLVTFPEFAIMMINATRMPNQNPLLNRIFHHNVHWIPYWRLCGVCNADVIPNAIVKMDKHFNEQMDYMLQESGLKELLNKYNLTTEDALPYKNPTNKTSNRAQKYFSQLTKSQVQDLWFKLRIDFEMFDYSIDPYLSYAQ